MEIRQSRQRCVMYCSLVHSASIVQNLLQVFSKNVEDITTWLLFDSALHRRISLSLAISYVSLQPFCQYQLISSSWWNEISFVRGRYKCRTWCGFPSWSCSIPTTHAHHLRFSHFLISSSPSGLMSNTSWLTSLWRLYKTDVVGQMKKLCTIFTKIAFSSRYFTVKLDGWSTFHSSAVTEYSKSPSIFPFPAVLLFYWPCHIYFLTYHGQVWVPNPAHYRELR